MARRRLRARSGLALCILGVVLVGAPVDASARANVGNALTVGAESVAVVHPLTAPAPDDPFGRLWRARPAPYRHGDPWPICPACTPTPKR